jgi:hypothetical protein
MTNEIEKAARAVIEAEDNIISLDEKENVSPIEKVDANIMLDKAIYNLRRSLDPQPTKEECINWLNQITDNVFFNEDGEEFEIPYCESNLKAIIQYLQEPQKGVWIENTGVNPNLSDCKLIIQYGGYDNCADLKEVHSSDLKAVDWVEWCPEDRIYQYMIIE